MTAAIGGPVTAAGADLPLGIGGRQCSWSTGGGRAVVVEIRVDADLDPMLRSQGISAVSVLEDSIATERDKLTPVSDLGREAFAGLGRIYVVAPGGTLVLVDEAGLDQSAEIALARVATGRF